MSQPDFSGLSEQFRLYYESLSADVAERFIQTVQATFGIKNRRNVELWVARGSVRRNFINRNVAPLELEMRVAFATALINNVPPSTPQKTRDFGIRVDLVSRKLRDYLLDDYTREAVSTIGFLAEDTVYNYDSDSASFEDIDDDASDEFDDIDTGLDGTPEEIDERL